MREAGAREGDLVTFWLSADEAITGELQHVPTTTGDTWVICTDEGDICHINMFSVMIVEGRKLE